MKIALQAFGREDFQRLIDWAHSPEFLLQWAGPIFRFPLDVPQLEEYLAAAGGIPPSRVIFKAVVGTEVVGHIELDMIDYRNRSARMSRVLIADAWRRRGVGSDMVRALLKARVRRAGVAPDRSLRIRFQSSGDSLLRKNGLRAGGAHQEGATHG